MKNAVFSAILIFSATASLAQAGTLSCSTNTTNSPRTSWTEMTIQSAGGNLARASVIEHSLEFSPEVDFSVTEKVTAPEIVVYENFQKEFKLTVRFGPNPPYTGHLESALWGRKQEFHVLCVMK